MNATRRKVLDKAISDLEEVKNQIEGVMDEEQETYDNMPEGLQQGDRGGKSLEAIDALFDAISQIEEACAQIENAKQ